MLSTRPKLSGSRHQKSQVEFLSFFVPLPPSAGPPSPNTPFNSPAPAPGPPLAVLRLVDLFLEQPQLDVTEVTDKAVQLHQKQPSLLEAILQVVSRVPNVDVRRGVGPINPEDPGTAS